VATLVPNRVGSALYKLLIFQHLGGSPSGSCG